MCDNLPMQSALVTGGAGFIGSHLVDRLLREGWRVTVLDSFTTYYNPEVKRRNLAAHLGDSNFELIEGDIRDEGAMDLVRKDRYDVFVHLAGKSGIQPSLTDPLGYQDVNVWGTQNVLEVARQLQVPQFVFG